MSSQSANIPHSHVDSTRLPVVVAVTGASGTAYAIRLLQALLSQSVAVELVISDAAREVCAHELGRPFPAGTAPLNEWEEFLQAALNGQSPAAAEPTAVRQPGSRASAEAVAHWGFQQRIISFRCSTAASPSIPLLRLHSHRSFSGGIASGSYRTRGMVICPCSMGTLAAVAAGLSTNLIHRAADVHLKERRPLLLVPRETPFSPLAFENMSRLSAAGAVVLPAAPGFYHRPASIADLVDFVVARICDHFGVDCQLMQRWGS
ncbi:MAG: UbiX family flavin prenyltransferase [Planctomycetaceae bacterium]|nr:UbiX family flavin prenyltransferase [Planctomycetaceae bacterium]